MLWRGKQGRYRFVVDPLWVLTKAWILLMSSLCTVSVHTVISMCNSACVRGVVNSALALHVVSICQSSGLFLQQISYEFCFNSCCKPVTPGWRPSTIAFPSSRTTGEACSPLVALEPEVGTVAQTCCLSPLSSEELCEVRRSLKGGS